MISFSLALSSGSAREIVELNWFKEFRKMCSAVPGEYKINVELNSETNTLILSIVPEDYTGMKHLADKKSDVCIEIIEQLNLIWFLIKNTMNVDLAGVISKFVLDIHLKTITRNSSHFRKETLTLS
jgi:hypothetical protein